MNINAVRLIFNEAGVYFGVKSLALPYMHIYSVLLSDKWQHSHVGQNKWRFLSKKDPVISQDF